MWPLQHKQSIQSIFLVALMYAALFSSSAHAGTIVNASCPCGYHKQGMFLFGGRRNFKTVCMVPALNLAHGDITLINVLDAGWRHRGGKKSLIPYTAQKLYRGSKNNIIASWFVQSLRKTYVLYGGAYLCPLCRRFTLHFKSAGRWD